ncbi:MAG: type II toxin-antitoxin system VapC family toxin [Chloroflexi bacterium]|nr:MAG: type II toxin-antitoxin system VapC family toxin [Chloroflexota bacterium]
MGAIVLAGLASVRERRRQLRELHGGVRGGPGAGVVWIGEVRAARADQGGIRPGQRLPPERQYQAGAAASLSPRERTTDLSDVLIEILRSNAQTARWVAAQASTGEALRYAPVSRAEIGTGMTAGEEKGIAALFAGLDAVTVDATTGALAGERLRRYRRSHRLELGDALIGASAEQYGERLATFNRRHYPGISRLASPDR